MKKIVFACLLFVLLCIMPKTSVRAEARLYFDPTSIQVAQDSAYQIRVMIDVGSTETVGAGAVIIYNKDAFTIQSVTNGGFYPKFESATNANDGKIDIQSFIDAIDSKKTGSGVLATITIVPKSSIQSESIVFQCISGVDDTSILDAQANNILSCSGTNIAVLTGGTASSIPTPTKGAILTVQPTKQTTPTPIEGGEPTMTPNQAAGGIIPPSLPGSLTVTPESVDPNQGYDNNIAPLPDVSGVDPLVYVLAAGIVAAIGIAIGYVIIRKVRLRNETVQNFTQTPEPSPPPPSSPGVPLADRSPDIQ